MAIAMTNAMNKPMTKAAISPSATNGAQNSAKHSKTERTDSKLTQARVFVGIESLVAHINHELVLTIVVSKVIAGYGRNGAPESCGVHWLTHG